jgi:phosphonate transport system substrate-binding protein
MKIRLYALAALFLGLVAATPAQPAEATAPTEIVFAFQRQKDPAAVKEMADRVAGSLSEGVGVPVKVMIPSSYGASVEALVGNQVQVAYLSAIPYLLAQSEAPVEILLVEERDGRADYDSVFVVRKDAPYQTLADLRGTRMMFTSSTSTSGYVMPWARLISDGHLKPGADPATFFSSTNFGGGYDRALLAVINNQADVCAVSDYTIEGPKADVYLPADKRAELRVLAETPGVPTHLICVRKDLPAEMRQKLAESLLKLSAEQPEVLADVYGASTFRKPDGDAHVAGARKALQDTGLGAKQLTQ